MPCSIAGTLEVAGEPWSPLIIRDVWVGLTRFGEIQRDLGISGKVLAERLKWLVAHGVLEQRLYSVPRGTYPCRLISVGHDPEDDTLKCCSRSHRSWPPPQPPSGGTSRTLTCVLGVLPSADNPRPPVMNRPYEALVGL